MEKLDFARYLKKKKDYCLGVVLFLGGLVLIFLAINNAQLTRELTWLQEEVEKWERKKTELQMKTAVLPALKVKVKEKRKRVNFFSSRIPENSFLELPRKVFFSLPSGVFVTFFRVKTGGDIFVEGYLEEDETKVTLIENLKEVFPGRQVELTRKSEGSSNEWIWFALVVKLDKEKEEGAI